MRIMSLQETSEGIIGLKIVELIRGRSTETIRERGLGHWTAHSDLVEIAKTYGVDFIVRTQETAPDVRDNIFQTVDEFETDRW